MEQYLDIIVSGVVAVVIALLGYIKSYIDNRRLKERLDNIVDVLHSEDNKYFVNCPKCDHKILLADVTIYSDKKE